MARVRVGRLAAWGAGSTVLAAWTVLSAFRQRSNFYAAAVYLSKSNACMMVRRRVSPPASTWIPLTRAHRTQILWNQALFHTVLLGKALQAIFFGELRVIETEVRIPHCQVGAKNSQAHTLRAWYIQRLQERAWFAVTETLLALTIFRQDFDSSFVVLFVSLLFLKVFHWLAADRVEAVRRHGLFARRRRSS